MTSQHYSGLVLALRLTTRGFGWALFEGDLAPADWDIASTKGDRNAAAMKRLQALVQKYQPSILVLEKFNDDDAYSDTRVRLLAKTMRAYAENHGIEVAVYSRAEIGKAVTGKPDASRYTVATAVAHQLPIFKQFLFEKRKRWQTEPYGQCLFDAVALGITHYTLTRRS